MWSGLLEDYASLHVQARFLPAGKTGGTRVPPNAGSRTNARWFKSKLPNPYKKSTIKVLFLFGRDYWIRTNGILLPKQALYQAELSPET